MSSYDLIAIWFIVVCSTVFGLCVNQIQVNGLQAAINDNGCASNQELIPIVRKIDNYNVDNLGGE